jgi:hypothetical protein
LVSVKPAQAEPADATAIVTRLFMLFQGWYGNLFIAKFATGARDINGKDKGIKSALVVWSSELREFAPDIVEAAAERCKETYLEFPPNLPQFVAICKAVRPRRAFAAAPTNRIGMSHELRASYSKRAREEALAKLRARIDAETGYMRVDDGLTGLTQLIAQGVALAGGDEVATLRGFDTMFSKKKAA